MTGKKAILWDNDGVLVDTEPVFFEANRRVLAGLGVEARWEDFLEISLRRGESLLAMAGGQGEELKRLHAERDELYAKLLESEDILVDGVDEMLGLLSGTFAMGIVTSSRRVHFELIHGRSGLLRHFEFVLTREDYARGKPHADGYMAGVERAGVAAAECLAVEDSPRGVEAALGAGVDCVLLGAGAMPEGMEAGGRVRRAANLSELQSMLREAASG